MSTNGDLRKSTKLKLKKKAKVV